MLKLVAVAALALASVNFVAAEPAWSTAQVLGAETNGPMNGVAVQVGAYYAAKDIDHRYAGVDFKSKDHHGEKIEASLQLAWTIASDLERYTLKAWNNAKNFRPRNA